MSDGRPKSKDLQTTEIDKRLVSLMDNFIDNSSDLFQFNRHYVREFEGGRYGCAILKPSKRMQQSMASDREILLISSSFSEQQQRSVKFIQSEIANSQGRLEPTVAIVLHLDPSGNAKLKNWGRDVGISLLPIDARQPLDSARDIEKRLSLQLFSHDPFDVTGPVSGDTNFFGRRDEAIDLARKLQLGQIRSCLGIRKVGKTSIINRILKEIPALFDCTTIMIDCSRDEIFEMSAEKLLASIGETLNSAKEFSKEYVSLSPAKSALSISEAREYLQNQILNSRNVILIVFDEVDYITPGSPTEKHWKRDFNRFWRNFRAIYQECDRQGCPFSILIGGVSTYWFTVDQIEGIENAALAFIPEEFLSPMPTGASIAMLRRLGRVSGLEIDEESAKVIAEETGNMPYWSRKCCSYIHRQIPITNRPYRLTVKDAMPLVGRFVDHEGITIAEVALSHLFRVHPLLFNAAKKLSEGKRDGISDSTIRTLAKYGVINSSGDFSGSMIKKAFSSIERQDSQYNVEFDTMTGSRETALSEWAEELATLGRRRNLIERSLRGISLNFLRLDALSGKKLESLESLILDPVNTKRREQLRGFPLDDIIRKLTWLELVAIIAKQWQLFEALFGDKRAFQSHAELVNDRPDAHAKEWDDADFALYRRSLQWFEDRLAKLQ